MAVEKRFLKYVSYWTTSEDDQESIPSTKRQFELAKVLEQELKELNLEKVRLDEHCYVYGLLPESSGIYCAYGHRTGFFRRKCKAADHRKL